MSIDDPMGNKHLSAVFAYKPLPPPDPVNFSIAERDAEGPVKLFA